MFKISMFALGVVAAATTASASPMAKAIMVDQDGKTIGQVELRETIHGTLVQARLSGLNVDGHGFHIHETGSCEDDFMAAGGHYDPKGHDHVKNNAGGHYAGDLPNIYAAADGTVYTDFFTKEVTLIDGDTALMDADGSSVIIHAKPDGYSVPPGAGSRIACGVIKISS